MEKAAHTTPGRTSFLLAPIYFIGFGLPAPTFSERTRLAGREHSWGGQRELHPQASLEHLGLGATLLGGGGVPGGDTSFTSKAVGSCAAPRRPPPKPWDKGMLCLIEKAGALARPKELGRELPRHAVGCGGPAQLRGGRQGHGCACVGGVTASVTDLPDVGGRVPGANLPSSHHEHPSSECSGEWLLLAAAVGCVWLANGQGPPRERAIQRVEEGGKLVVAALAKGNLFPGAKCYRPRWRDLGTRHKPHSVLHSPALHIIINPSRMVEFQKELETSRSVHPSAPECRTKWLGLICQKPRLCLEDDK